MAKEAQNSTSEGNVTALPNIDISSPEAAKKTLREFLSWMHDNDWRPDATFAVAHDINYVRCCIDAMRFPNAHKSEAMKQAAQEAINKLKAMLADSGR